MDELDRAVNEQEATGVGQGEAIVVFPVSEPCIACSQSGEEQKCKLLFTRNEQSPYNDGIGFFAYFEGTPEHKDLLHAFTRRYKLEHKEECGFQPEKQDTSCEGALRKGVERWFLCQAV